MLYDALMTALADDVMPSSVESPIALIGGSVAAAAGVAVAVASAGSPSPSAAITRAQRAKVPSPSRQRSPPAPRYLTRLRRPD